MNRDERQQAIIRQLRHAEMPVSGGLLAKNLKVSRQLIVQDVSFLKALGYDIVSTHKGYLLTGSPYPKRIFQVNHTTSQIRDELYSVVDHDGELLDVFVRHPLYGELRATLALFSRQDVDAFFDELDTSKMLPLKYLTDDDHFHTVAAPTDSLLDAIEETLRTKGYLIKATSVEEP